MALCNPACFSELTPFSTVDVCNLAEALRSAEIAKLVFIRCDVVFTDVTSPTEWQGYLDDNKVIITLPGRGTIDAKTEDGVLRINCQDVATASTYPFTYESELVDKALATEWTIYNDLNNNKLNLTVAFLTCDGFLIVNPNYASASQLGLNLDSLNITPVYSGEKNSKTKYQINGSLNETQILRPIKLASGVVAIL